MLEDVGRIPEEKVVEDLVHYKISSDRFFLFEWNMKKQKRTEIIEILKENIEVISWIPYEMPRIDPSFIKHELNVMPKAWLVKQRGKRSSMEHVDIVLEKVKKLNKASAIRDVLSSNWLSYTVVVKEEEWQVVSLHQFYKP